jgi:hypothetical protein
MDLPGFRESVLVSDVCCCDMHDSRKLLLGQRSSFGQSSHSLLYLVKGRGSTSSWLETIELAGLHSRNFAKYKSVMEADSDSGERCVRCPRDGTSMNTVVSDWVLSDRQHHRTVMEVVAHTVLDYIVVSFAFHRPIMKSPRRAGTYHSW